MVVDELFEAGEEGHSITLRGSHCPEVPRPASVDRLPRMRQGFFGAALPGLPGAAVTEGVVTVQSTWRREAFMAPVCIVCKQPISRFYLGRPIGDEWRHIPPCPKSAQRTGPLQRVSQLWRAVTARLRR